MVFQDGSTFSEDDEYFVAAICNRTMYIDHDEYILEDYSLRVALATILCVIFLIGIFGNSLVVMAVVLCRRLQDTTNVFVVNLAIADLLTCLLLPVHVGTLLHKGSCHIPDRFCMFVSALTLTTLGCSVVSMAFIAFNRYQLIRSSMTPKTTLLDIFKKRNLVAMVVFSWVYPILLMCIVIPAGMGSLGYSHQYKVCSQNSDNRNSDYLSLTAGLLIQLPAFLIIIVCYLLILRLVRWNDRNLAKRISSVTSTSTVPSDTDLAVDVVEGVSACPNQSQCQEDSCHIKHLTESLQKSSLDLPIPPKPSPILECQTCNSPTVCRVVAQNQLTESATSNTQIQGNTPVTSLQTKQIPRLPDQSCDDQHLTTKKNSSSLVDQYPISRKPKTAISSSDQVITVERLSIIKMKQLYKKQLRITINLFIVICAYTVCVVPLGVAILIPSSDPVIPWFSVLFLSNCCINPIIYALKHPNFSEVFAYILKCQIKKIPDPSHLQRSLCGRNR